MRTVYSDKVSNEISFYFLCWLELLADNVRNKILASTSNRQETVSSRFNSSSLSQAAGHPIDYSFDRIRWHVGLLSYVCLQQLPFPDNVTVGPNVYFKDKFHANAFPCLPESV